MAAGPEKQKSDEGGRYRMQRGLLAVRLEAKNKGSVDHRGKVKSKKNSMTASGS